MPKQLKIAVIPGDGIGKEVMPEGLRVLAAAAKRFDLDLAYTHIAWASCDYHAQHRQMMPDDWKAQLAGMDAIYFGAVGWPATVPDHVSLWGSLLKFRREFDQYINLRPVRLFEGVPCPLAGRKAGDIDFFVVRENTEGEYTNLGGVMYAGTEREIVIQESVYSRFGADRVLKYAFELARSRARKHLTVATKSNGIAISMPWWDGRADAMATGYPEVTVDKQHIDILSARFVLQPTRFDVVVASNLFGDILSDLGPACTGTIGLAPSANLNPERNFPSLFEPVHGSAPDIYGKNIANPVAMIWSAALMLDFLGHRDAHDAIVSAIEAVLIDGPHTPDLGGKASTTAMGEAIAAKVADRREGCREGCRTAGLTVDAAIRLWLDALRRGADAAELRALPALSDEDAARVMASLREPPAPAPAEPVAPTTPTGADLPVPGELVPRLSLQTLTRGDGLLGLRAMQGFGPRGAQLTVARVDWTYTLAGGLGWETPAPTGVLNTRPKPTQLLRGAWNERVLLQRDLPAEADARDALAATGLRPLPMRAIQWRDHEAGIGHGELWSLSEESQFGDFWAEQLPRLRAAGWSVIVQPGFAHLSVPVERWHLVVDPVTDDAQAHGPAGIAALRQPVREGSFMLSLGVEVDGETLDLAPLLADLLKRDHRWLDARQITLIHDATLVTLRAPGGRRIEALAGPLKAIVGAMLDLLTDPRRKDGPMQLSNWEAQRIEAMRLTLLDTQAARAGEHGAWQLQGDAGLTTLAKRLRAAGTPPVVDAPEGLGLTLRPYQLQGLAWLQYLREHRLAGILADDMGLGKTAQVLAHLLIEKHAGRLDRPALVVLPTSLIANWQAEAARHTPALRALALQGADRAPRFARIAEHDVVFTTYPLLWRDIEALEAHEWHLLILDEAQMVKNAASRAATALRRLTARHRLCVTGTPLENHLGELWAHFDFLMPGFLGDARSFARLWRKPIETNGETLRAELLAQRVRPFILRRRKADVASELPLKTEVIRLVQLHGAQRALYESVRVAADEQVRRVLARTSFDGAQITILDALLKLRQVCCDPLLVKGSKLPSTMPRAKLEWLRDMLPELVAEGRRVLVFSQFTEMLALVATELDALELPFLELTGDTPVRARGAVVNRFQAKEVPIFLVSLKAGGVGLNLTAADTVIHLDPWWNPAVERQATDRAHRIGQDQPVFVYKLVAEGSIEERMLALQARKAALAEGVLGSDAAAAVKFDAEDLRGLLAPLA